VINLFKCKIGELLRVSKYKREYIIKELNITHNTLSNWVTGKTYPTADKLFILADLLECKVDDFYEYKK